MRRWSSDSSTTSRKSGATRCAAGTLVWPPCGRSCATHRCKTRAHYRRSSGYLPFPSKRCDQPLLGFLSRDEIAAILAAPDRSTWSGRRDHVMLTVFYNTGARVSEIIRLRATDVVLGTGACIHIHGKGRKQRSTPLWRSTARLLEDWLACGRRTP